jgi:hypothetical protein
MIASNMENPFFFDIFRQIESDALARGYEVVVAKLGLSARPTGIENTSEDNLPAGHQAPGCDSGDSCLTQDRGAI